MAGVMTKFARSFGIAMGVPALLRTYAWKGRRIRPSLPTALLGYVLLYMPLLARSRRVKLTEYDQSQFNLTRYINTCTVTACWSQKNTTLKIILQQQ